MAKLTCNIVGIPQNVEIVAAVTDAPWFAATAVVTNSCHRLPKRLLE